MQPGDLLFTHAHTPLSWAIRLGQSLRFHKDYSEWSHVALVLSSNGALVEAHSSGIKLANISEYEAAGTKYLHVPVPMDDRDRARVVSFGRSQIGDHYAFLTFSSLIFNLFSPGRWGIVLDNSLICSAFAARCLERANYTFPHTPELMVPADLMQYAVEHFNFRQTAE